MSLHLGASFSAGWEGVLLPWFRDAATTAWTRPEPTLVVVPLRSHAHQLKARLLAESLPLPAIRFVTPAELRAAFAGLEPSRLALREHLRLLLSIAAEHEPGTPSARAVARAPDHLLRAVDELGAAGWAFEDAGPAELRPIVHHFRRLIDQCGFELVHDFDRAALARARESRAPLFANLLLTGFDAAHWPLWPLLRAGVQAAARATVVLADPREEARDLDECWVGTWEQTFGAAEPIPAAAASPRFTGLTLLPEGEAAIARLATQEDRAVDFLVGRHTTEQARAIAALALQYLAADSHARIGIVFAGPGALPRAVSALLTQAAVPHNDGLAHLAPGPFESPAWHAWLTLQDAPQLDALLRFLRALEKADTLFAGMEIEQVEDALRRAFAEVLIDDLAVLRAWCARRGDRAVRVAEGLAKIALLPPVATLAAYLAETRQMFAQLGWSDRWAEVARVAHGWSEAVEPEFSRPIFLRWLAEITRSFSSVREEQGSHPYSRVHLLSHAQAAGQEWSHLILAGLNEGEWPPRFDEEGFVREQEIAELNAQITQLNQRVVREGRQGEGHRCVRDGYTLCLGPLQQRQLTLRTFLNTIDTTAARLAATASLFDESAPDRRKNPSEFFTRLYFCARGRTLSHATMDALRAETATWLDRTELLKNASVQPDADIRQTRVAYDARRSTGPAGEYDFALTQPPAEPVALWVTDFERAMKAPALVWMKAFLGVEGDAELGDGWALATGQWVHRWLAQISGAAGTNQFTDRPDGAETRAIVRGEAHRFREETEALLATCGRPLPDWWCSGWSQALYLADCLAARVAAVKEWPRLATEWKLPKPQILPIDDSHALRVNGRADLVLARGTAANELGCDSAWVIDYKTGHLKSLGSRGTPEVRAGKLRRKLLGGDAIQLALYALALREHGAREVGLSLLSGNLTLDQPQLVLAEIEAQRDVWIGLAKMQASGVFGMRGAVRSEWSFTGAYPLATLAIHGDLLAEKWAATHREFASDAEEEEEE